MCKPIAKCCHCMFIPEVFSHTYAASIKLDYETSQNIIYNLIQRSVVTSSITRKSRASSLANKWSIMASFTVPNITTCCFCICILYVILRLETCDNKSIRFKYFFTNLCTNSFTKKAQAIPCHPKYLSRLHITNVLVYFCLWNIKSPPPI